jgi:hypothetical protein
MIINRSYENKNLLSLYLLSFLVGLRNYQHVGTAPIIRKLVIRISNCPDRLGPSGKHVLTLIVLHLVMAEILFAFVKYIKGITHIIMIYLYVNNYIA